MDMNLHHPTIAMQAEPMSREEDEGQWLRCARRGDQAAFERIYCRHSAAVHGLAWRLTADRALAEDITQEAFLRLLRRIGGADPGRPLRPWLNQVASNLAIDHLRRTLRETSDIALPEPGAIAPEPADCSEASGLLSQLAPISRTLVWLNQVEGWSHQALGRKFGRSESWSKSIVSRALAQLRDIAHPGDRHES